MALRASNRRRPGARAGRRRRPRGRGAQLGLLIELLRRLTADWWTIAELADDLGVHPRTIYRAIRAIRRAALPLESVAGLDPEHPRLRSHRLPRQWWR